MDTEGQGTYIAQLREVFNSCDERETGYLNETELFSLCLKLQLFDQSDDLVAHLLRNDKTKVDFNEFKEGFIALLTAGHHHDNDDDENAAQREVSPKFTLGAKKYGRRSRPASIVENDDTIANGEDNSDGEVFNEDGEVIQEEESQGSESAGRDVPDSVTATTSPDETQPSHWITPEQYLSNLWKRLGIGKDGYLKVSELASVCQHIGMETTHDTMTQLFDKLDSDRDGRVTFDELVQGLFQHGVPDTTPASIKSPTPSEMSFTCSPIKDRVYRLDSQEDMQISEPCLDSSIFSSIDPDGDRYVLASSIVDLWESLGVPCGMQLLQDLGFNVKMKINLEDLSLLLEEELNNASTDHVYQAALATLQHELRHSKRFASQLETERNKLKEAVTETNDRAALLAQEIDDHHARLEETSQNKILGLEKRYHEQLRELQGQLRKERDLLSTQITNVKATLEKELEASQAEEGKLKEELTIQQSDNVRLDKELQEILSRCSQTESRNVQLQKELDSLCEVKRKLSELEAVNQEDCNDTINLELSELRRQNKDLQDHTVELTLEVDNLKQMLMSNGRYSAKRHNRTNSWLADYTKGYTEALNSGTGLKRRGSGSSSDGNSEDDSRMVGKVARRLSVSSSGGDVLLMGTYETDDLMEDDGACSSLGHDQNRHQNISKIGIKLTSCSSYPQLLSPNDKISPDREHQSQDLSQKLAEEIALRNKVIEEKDETIAKLNENFKNMLEMHESKYEAETERNRQSELRADSLRTDIRTSLCELYELVQSYIPTKYSEHAGSLKRNVEEQFSKVLLLVEKPDEMQQQNGRLFQNEELILPTKMDTLLGDLFVENGRLMTELKLAEEQRSKAEKSNGKLHYKCKMLSRLLKDVTHSNIK